MYETLNSNTSTKVLLGSILSHDKTKTENSATRQVCSLRTPVTLPRPHPDAITVGYLNVVLILEDFGLVNGAVQESKETAAVVENDPSGDETGSLRNEQHLVGSQEYKIAMELELWKLSQQETFEVSVYMLHTCTLLALEIYKHTQMGSAGFSEALHKHSYTHTHFLLKEQLKSREASHMAKLGAELQRRESQRQALLKQKVDHYTSLEAKLKDGLLQLQLQQKTVAEREAKVCLT